MKCLEILNTCNYVNEEQKQILDSLKSFFEGKAAFDLQEINKLDKDVLLVALKALNSYYTEDQYLLNEYKVLFLSKNDPLINQTKFAEILNDNGFNFNRNKFSVYLSRGLMPPHDLQIGNKKYWYESTAKKFINDNGSKLMYEF